jgi:hypothetical protein
MQALAVTVLPALAAISGAFVLALCIGRLRRLIFPTVKSRFDASSDPHDVYQPTSGRYVISIVIPLLTFIVGTDHATASFIIRNVETGTPIAYQAYGRALLQVKRSDMGGRRYVPLGSFVCPTPGRVEIVCINPDVIRRNCQLEVSPHVAVLPFIVLVLVTLASSAMFIGGTVLGILGFTGAV